MHKCPECGCEFENELIATTSDAEEIYKLYPACRRIAKARTIAAIKRALKKVPFPELKRRVMAFVVAWDNADMSFCPQSATWFGQNRWADDPETWAPKQKRIQNGPPIWKQIEALEQRIATHPANPHWVGADMRTVTEEQRVELRKMRARLAELKQQPII